ncbi:MAG: periplasmic sensor signal transduction histidine kinase [Acidobacteriaceae bacterium]|nr:periplasmic sensor signal transduction histidine kinase [Acidobacteriaceae bacterium]
MALACVLIILANLQYRWSHEVSDATSTRLRADLQISLMDFREDLARELTTMSLELQSHSNTKSVDAKTLTAKFRQWQRTASYSGLVANVYVWNPASRQTRKEGAPSLLRLLPDEGRFEAIPWPTAFDHLHEFLDNALATALEASPRKPIQKHPPSNGGAGKAFSGQASPMLAAVDESIPMLIVSATRSNSHETDVDPNATWLLIELDENVLRSRVFPRLVSRYYGDPGTADYEVAVVGGSEDKPQVLYSSDGDFGADKQAPADATLNLFGPPNFGGNRKPTSDWPGLGFFPGFDRQSRGSSRPQLIEMSGPIRFDPIYSTPNSRGWQLIAKNRKGSVEAAVEELRRRELGVSFGVLLILAATMALIIFASQRARHLATLQMDFVAGVSHELRTPIAAILSAAENISDGVVESKQQMIRYGGIITNQARQLNHLVEQVLRFSATRAKTPKYNLRTLNVSDVVNAALENTATVVQNSGVTLERLIEPSLPSVRADLEVLSQCLQNLITNAAKYGGDRKWIGIRAQLAKRGGNASEIEITVEDHGIGIDEYEMKEIFDPFYRSPKVTASHIHGSGLGLSLAKSFAEAIGGRLTVRSEVGKGSAFTVHLPIATAQQPEQNAVIAASAGPTSS